MEKTERKEIVLYARTSTEEQNTENQLLMLRDYCERMGFVIKDEYIDNGFSGKNENRPAFERLLFDMRQGMVKAILVYKLDRIGRSLKHLLNLFEEFRNLDIEFISLTQNINTATPEGKMFWQMLGVFAEYERGLIVSRTLSGLARAKRQGKTLGRPHGATDKKRRRLSGYYQRWINNGGVGKARRAYICNFQNG